MIKFPYIFRQHPTDKSAQHSPHGMSRSTMKCSNSSTRRSSLTSNCSRVSNASSLWSSASSGISSLDVSLMSGPNKDMSSIGSQSIQPTSMTENNEVNVIVGRDMINLNDCTAPQISSGQGMINSEIMRCLVNHTKMLEGVTRELRLELSLYHQKRNSRKSTQKKQVKFNRQDALVLQEIGGCCAESLKHVKNLYDETRYL